MEVLAMYSLQVCTLQTQEFWSTLFCIISIIKEKNVYCVYNYIITLSRTVMTEEKLHFWTDIDENPIFCFGHIWWLSVFPRVASGSSISNLVSPPWSPSFQAGRHRTPSHWTWPQPWTFRSWIWPSGHSRRNAWQRHIAKYIYVSSLIYPPKPTGNAFSTQLPLAS